MRTIQLGKSDLQVPAIGVGCMRIAEFDDAQAENFITNAIEQGANFFDHADIYGGGMCETVFGRLIKQKPSIREKMILQDKCGIRRGSFDFSKQYIIESVDGCLKRLNTDYIDVFLLHRPDALMEPEEVADAFDTLYSSGKVRHFGVSNQDTFTIQLLQSALNRPLVTNQLQLSITNATLITHSLNINMLDEMSLNRDNGVLNFCRLNKITIQAWSPFQYGFFEGTFLNNDKFPKLNAVLDDIAKKYDATNTAIALAWILRHPAHIQPITGTTSISRLADCISAVDITLTRKEWYDIYLAAGHRLP